MFGRSMRPWESVPATAGRDLAAIRAGARCYMDCGECGQLAVRTLICPLKFSLYAAAIRRVDLAWRPSDVAFSVVARRACQTPQIFDHFRYDGSVAFFPIELRRQSRPHDALQSVRSGPFREIEHQLRWAFARGPPRISVSRCRETPSRRRRASRAASTCV